jgi:GH35 family endo-1,4-beta-xylanase
MSIQQKINICLFFMFLAVLPAAETMLAPDAFKNATFTVQSESIGRELAPGESTAGLVRRFDVDARALQFYTAQLLLPVAAPVTRGETLHVSFEARTTAVADESGQGQLTVYFQQAAPRWEKPLNVPVALSGEWTRYQFPFSVDTGFHHGERGQLGFGFGGREQTVELRDVRLMNYGPDVAVESLPRTRSSYEGRAPDAAWRALAEERIDQIRKANLQIEVVDASGAPVSDAQVSIQQTRHAFYFGTAVSVGSINDPSADGVRYRDRLVEWFNHAVVESALKWPAWIGEVDLSGEGTIDGAMQWLRDQGMHVKGHVLVWPSFRKLPKAIVALRDDPQALRRAVATRITEAVRHYSPYVDEWDVINEPYTCHDVQDILGHEVVQEWFALAHAAAPDTPLYLNDYGILTGGDASPTPHRQAYAALIRELLDAGAPLDAIGMQGHFGEDLTPPEAVYQILEHYSQFGLPLQVTEFDLDTADEALQADYTRDFMTMVFSHPQVNGFVNWGFWEGRHWRPRAAMFTKDWKLKPNGQVYHDLVYNQWWTRATGVTDPDGIFEARAFLGDYLIIVAKGGQSIERKLTLSKASGENRIQFIF